MDENHETMVPLPDRLSPDLQIMHKYTLKMNHDEQVQILIDIGVPGKNKQISIGREEIFQFLAQAQIRDYHMLTYMS